jgi:hypothetical protein
VTIVPKPTVSAIYNPPACDQKEFTVDVVSPIIGYTYSISQPGNPTNSKLVSPNTPQTPTAGSPLVHFTGLTAGDGFIVTVNANVPGATCTGTTNCAQSTNSCTDPVGRIATTSTDQSNIVAEKAVDKTIVSDAKTETSSVAESYKISLGAPARVTALPNPFTDKIRFNLTSSVSGSGLLELYNTLGQKVGTVYSGYVQAGVTFNKEYNVPAGKRGTLIYVFTVGDQKVTGKLMGLR